MCSCDLTIFFQIADIDDPDSVSGSVSLGGFPPAEERSRPDGAEEEAPDANRTRCVFSRIFWLIKHTKINV